MANPELFTQLDALIASAPPAQWQAYLRFHVASAMAPYLPKPWRDADFAFRGRLLRGQAAPPPRWQQVLDAINLAAGPMLGREYTARYLPAATRTQAEVIAGGVRDALGRAVERDSWMSAAAKAEARAKLAELDIEIAAPREDIDYSAQPMGRGSFGSNLLIASAWRHREEMKRIGRHNGERRWDVLQQQPTLSYDLANNRLVVSAAMLQAPVFDPGKEQAAQYGAFGALVGHELSHSVDDKGRLVDAAGHVRDWWTAADTAAWQQRGARVASQFDGYVFPNASGAKVRGQQTREINLADLAGVELAWEALRAAQPAPPAATGQAFYRAWAGLWAQQLAPATAQRRVVVDVHAPGQWRTNGPLANQPAFGQAFACKAGTPMQRGSGEQLTLWR